VEQERSRAPAGNEVEALLDSSWPAGDRKIRGRELRLELAVTASFVAAAAGVIALAPSAIELNPIVAAVVVAYAIAANASFPMGAGLAAPTQLFLVPMFALAPAQAVPALVFLALALRAAGAAVAGRERPDRLVMCGGDAMHALGPALVLVIFTSGNATEASPAVILLAFAAQLGFDFISSYLHDLLVYRVRPALHVKVLAQVWGIDAALLPFGVLAALVSQSQPWAALAPLPLVLLLSALASDRARRIAAAHERLEELERERHRREVAMERIGEALGSKLDLGALIEVVTRIATEALDGGAGRGTAHRASALHPSSTVLVNEPGHLLPALELAEREARESSQLSQVKQDGAFALAGAVGNPREPIALIAIARSSPFANEDRALLAQLCQQAAVAVDDAVRHERLRAAEAQLRHQAFHDPLTGLANRARFVEIVERSVRRHADGQREVAVLFLDLDEFKIANDTLGHDAGDELLIAIAQRISRCVGSAQTVARFGGDEFAVLLQNLSGRGEAEALAEEVLAKLSDPVTIRARQFVVQASIGLAFSGPGIGHEQLLRNADQAMYAAKQAGGNRVAPFRQEMLIRANERIELAEELPEALRERRFELFYQPIIDLTSGDVPAVEALVRWRHPERGLLRPDDFIPIAEHMGVIAELGRLVFDSACRLTAVGLPDAIGNAQVSVNVSPVQLRDVHLAADLIDSIRRHDVEPERMIVEVTESLAIEADSETRRNLRQLHELGVTIALDDFGTGYSALSYLARLPIDVVKLDRTFMATVDHDPHQARLVRAVTQLASSLGIAVVAEGLERPRQLQVARELGAQLGQGFGIAEPMDAEALVRWLSAWDRGSERPHALARAVA
jgi:diguanylate cyclase (GGDEF)-like protein